MTEDREYTGSIIPPDEGWGEAPEVVEGEAQPETDDDAGADDDDGSDVDDEGEG